MLPEQRTARLYESAYEAGSRLAGWDTAELTSAWCPAPSQLQVLQAGAAGACGRAPFAA